MLLQSLIVWGAVSVQKILTTGALMASLSMVSVSALSVEGIRSTSDSSGIIYFEDEGWTGRWNYVCLQHDCRTGQVIDGEYQREVFGLVPGQTYNIRIKVQMNENPGQFISELIPVVFQPEPVMPQLSDVVPVSQEGFVANPDGLAEESGFARMSVSPNGEVAFAVWRQNTPFDHEREAPFEQPFYSVWGARFINGVWENPVLLEDTNEPHAFFPDSVSPGSSLRYITRIPDVAVDNQGNAMAVWHQFDGVRTHIWANRFDSAADAWQGAEQIEDLDYSEDVASGGVGFSSQARVGMDAEGDAVVVWQKNGNVLWEPLESFPTGIYSNVYDAQTGTWSGEELISETFGIIYSPNIAVNDAGDAVATWHQDFVLRANQFDGETESWGDVEVIDSGDGVMDDSINQKFPEVAMNNEGQAVVTWVSGQANINARVLNPESGTWGDSHTFLEAEFGTGYQPVVDFNDEGLATIVWAQEGGLAPVEGQRRVWVSQLQTAEDAEWSAPLLVDPMNQGNVDLPAVDVTDDGDVFVAWHEFGIDPTDGSLGDNLWVNYFDHDLGWTEPTLLEDTFFIGWNPQVSFMGNGDALFIWEQPGEPGGDLNNIMSRVAMPQ